MKPFELELRILAGLQLNPAETIRQLGVEPYPRNGEEESIWEWRARIERQAKEIAIERVAAALRSTGIKFPNGG